MIDLDKGLGLKSYYEVEKKVVWTVYEVVLFRELHRPLKTIWKM